MAFMLACLALSIVISEFAVEDIFEVCCSPDGD
jgi:hypothetical protein